MLSRNGAHSRHAATLRRHTQTTIRQAVVVWSLSKGQHSRGGVEGAARWIKTDRQAIAESSALRRSQTRGILGGGKNRQGNGGRDDEARTWQRWDAASRWVPRWRARSQYTMRRHGGVRLTKFDRGPPGLRAWGPSRRLASRQGHHCGPLRATAGHRALRPCQTAARVGGCFAPDLRVRLPAHRGRDNFFLRGKQGSVRFFNRGSLLFFSYFFLESHE